MEALWQKDKDELLFEACERKDFVEAKQLLKDGADPRKRYDSSLLPTYYYDISLINRYFQCTSLHIASLHIASLHGQLDFLKLLVETYHCDPEVETSGGCSGLRPLHLACVAGHLNIVRYLVELGCDAECVDEWWGTPLLWACGCRRWIVGRDMWPSDERALEVVRFLTTTANCDANKRERVYDRNALLWSCNSGRTSVARFLVSELHCSVAVHDKYGDTPVYLASQSNSRQLLRFLISEAKCDPNVKNSDGNTPVHDASRYNRPEALRILISETKCDPNVKDNDGNTPVHLASQSESLEALRFLISEAKCDPNMKNSDGQTPLQMTTDPDTIRELIKNGANATDMYKDYGHLLGRSFKQPLPNPVKLLIVGDPSSGKSTLTESLQNESLLNRVVKLKVGGVNEKTAGVVPHQFKSKWYGHVSLYDFAGQREFYNSHGALLQNTVQCSAPIFLVVVDLCMSDEEIVHNILYWLCFIDNQCTSKSHIIVIGSHIDLLKSKGEDPDLKTKRIASSLKQSSRFSSFTLAGYVAMDCRYPESSGMRELRQCLQKSCDDLRPPNQMTDFRSHCLLVFLIDKFQHSTAVSLSRVYAEVSAMNIDRIDDKNYFLPQSIGGICNYCEQLNERGHILFLKNLITIENSWIILNQTVLLSEVSGTIFAPEGFKQHTKLASSTGVVPLSNITGKFPTHNPEMLIGFLSHLEFCHEISDKEVMQLISETEPIVSDVSEVTSSPQQERYFLFPGLVTLEVPTCIWEPQPQFVHHCGWILQCSQPEQFFVPRFLQVVLLRLAFSYALTPKAVELTSDHPAIERKCFIWTNGIFWADVDGVETLVEFKDQSEAVVVWMRCRQDNVTNCLKLRSLVIQKVLAAVCEFCPKVSTTESFIDPSEIAQYPLKPTSQLTLFNMASVAESVVTGKSSVVSMSVKSQSLESVLLFEPYADLGEPILHKLFDDQAPSLKVTEKEAVEIAPRFLIRLSEQDRREIILKLFAISPMCLADVMSEAGVRSVDHEIIRVLLLWVARGGTEGTYQCLRDKLDQYSAFTGRNPLQLAAEL